MSSQASEATRPRTRSPTRPRERKWILVAHIAASVGLLGDTAAILVLGAVASATGDAHLANAAYTFMRLLIPMFGIPLTLVALASGLVLAFRTGTGGLRPFWVRAKLFLALGVVAVGAFLLAPVAFPSGPAHGAASAIVGASLDVAALLTAVSLSSRSRLSLACGTRCRAPDDVRGPSTRSRATKPMSEIAVYGRGGSLWLVTLRALAARLLGIHVGRLRGVLSGLAGIGIGYLASRAVPRGAENFAVYLFFAVLGMISCVALLDFLVRPSTLGQPEQSFVAPPHPLRALRRRWGRTRRYAQVVRIATRHRLLSTLAARTGGSTIAGDDELGREIAAALEEAGGMFVKLGQALSNEAGSTSAGARRPADEAAGPCRTG